MPKIPQDATQINLNSQSQNLRAPLDFVFVTGNQDKANYLAKWLGYPVEHHAYEVDELQSVDLQEIAEHKARSAYQKAGQPVLVEDVALTIHAWGHLPGPLIKWFLEEVDCQGIVDMLKAFPDRSATASIVYALYDGQRMQFFTGEVPGKIAEQPRASEKSGWHSSRSWNSIFIPDGYNKTYAEMTDEELEPISHRAQAINKLRGYLQTVPS